MMNFAWVVVMIVWNVAMVVLAKVNANGMIRRNHELLEMIEEDDGHNAAVKMCRKFFIDALMINMGFGLVINALIAYVMYMN